MAIPASIERYVTSHGMSFTPIHYHVAFTAQEEAAAAHVRGREWAKTVVCLADGKPVLALLPAHYRVDVNALKALTNATQVRLATEHELAGLYPDCDTGAMAPFGELYGQDVYMDDSLAADAEIVFHAGTHADAMRMRLDDFLALVRPVVGRFAGPAHGGH
ncbi:MAG TPA: YbaK/EbsC family protein [Vicinamibacterales bacterium]|nr:YbaK/EbsC family protein [Vicinamibacterales bacterium]HOQ59069.1 YbaK/EbsC family protein [Vicinamibacterales bacterium]HPK71744.1 YbaK/EbsC family protein [Vicinamibacterales bacterium]